MEEGTARLRLRVVPGVRASGIVAREHSINLVAGHGRRDKIVEFTGITRADIESRLAAAERKDLG